MILDVAERENQLRSMEYTFIFRLSIFIVFYCKFCIVCSSLVFLIFLNRSWPFSGPVYEFMRVNAGYFIAIWLYRLTWCDCPTQLIVLSLTFCLVQQISRDRLKRLPFWLHSEHQYNSYMLLDVSISCFWAPSPISIFNWHADIDKMLFFCQVVSPWVLIQSWISLVHCQALPKHITDLWTIWSENH